MVALPARPLTIARMLSWLLAPPAPPLGAWPSERRRVVRCRDDDEEAPQWTASAPREKAYSDVLALVREGLSPPNIASRLCLKRTTVLAQLAVLERRGQAIKLERGVWAAL
ncbi:MAG: hypothetical protein LKCHEGNO_03590 [Burkholderiaceae bacterium]|nr:hypothetical protein [Burkholderiaceae bacterium]